MLDILVTTYNRVELLKKCIDSIIQNTTCEYKLLIADDCSTDGTREYLAGLKSQTPLYILTQGKQSGLVPNFNRLWALSNYLNKVEQPSQYMCYIQDDMQVVISGWHNILIDTYNKFKQSRQVGFFCGVNSKDHLTKEELLWHKNRALIKIKYSARASNLMAERNFWNSIGYIPILNPDGTTRGFPHKGHGSNIDLYLTGCQSGSIFSSKYAAPYCSYLQERYVLVVEGLLEHMAEDTCSTWRDDSHVPYYKKQHQQLTDR